MCYERRRAEACLDEDESAHHALVNGGGGREIVCVCVFYYCRTVCVCVCSIVQSCSESRVSVDSERILVCVCVYYCRTYDKAVCGGGGGQ